MAILNFEVGKYYRYDRHNTRPKGWNQSGAMDFALNRKIMKCTRTDNHALYQANFAEYEMGYLERDICWSWKDTIEYWFECFTLDELFAKTKYLYIKVDDRNSFNTLMIKLEELEYTWSRNCEATEYEPPALSNHNTMYTIFLDSSSKRISYSEDGTLSFGILNINFKNIRWEIKDTKQYHGLDFIGQCPTRNFFVDYKGSKHILLAITLVGGYAKNAHLLTIDNDNPITKIDYLTNISVWSDKKEEINKSIAKLEADLAELKKQAKGL